jgi:hypothetical protein
MLLLVSCVFLAVIISHVMSTRDSDQSLPKVSIFLFSLAVPLCLLAVGLFMGIGLIRKVSPSWNLFLACSVVLIPPLSCSISSNFRSQLVGLGYCVWPLLIVYAFPMYFPNERETAITSGLAMFSVSSVVSSTIHKRFPSAPNGREPLPIASVPEVKIYDKFEVDLPPDVATIPFEGEGASMSVPLTIALNADEEQDVWMLFDTGASLTTFDQATLFSLGVDVPADAPNISMQTANGESQARLVLVNDVWFAGMEVGTITVAVCDACADNNKVGLLGLNISSRFLVTVDSHRKELLLKPRPSKEVDLTYEIRPWLHVEATATQWPGGRVEVEAIVSNNAKKTISSVDVEIRCRESYYTTLQEIPPEGKKNALVLLPDGAKCDVYAIGLRKARW